MADKKEKSRKKKGGLFRFLIKTAVIAALAAAVLLAATNIWVCSVGGGRIVPEASAKQADAIIVLGALVWDDGQPSSMLQDRLDTAYALYKAGKAPKILVSGDHSREEYDEVNGMRRYLEDKGVPTEAIFMDHAGFDTYSTMYRARGVFVVKTAIVVTQKYHLYRALFLADSMGIDAQGVDCERYKSKYQLYYDAREIAARAKDFFTALVFKPQPKYLGDEMPISGSGVVTHDE
jgi:SanA protein